MTRRIVMLAGIGILSAGYLAADRTVLQPISRSGATEWRPAATADSVPTSIAGAEAHASDVSPSTAGSALPRKCVTVDSLSDGHSGDFTVAPFEVYRQYWDLNYGKLVWTSNQNWQLNEATQLIVRVFRVDDPQRAFIYKSQHQVIRRWGEGTEGRPMQWGTLMHVPTRGTWVFVATANRSWGCFVVTI